MHITSFGFESEFFVLKDGKPVLASGLPADACGYLAEARSKPDGDPTMAAYLHLAAEDLLARQAKELGLTLVKADTLDIPRETLRQWMRRFGKNPAKSYFMGGGCYRNTNPRAGLHVHFSSTETIVDKEGRTRVIAKQLNIPRIIFLMDRAFKPIIKASKRIPGEYELKNYGFEYRSLPATVNPLDVVPVLQEILGD